MPRVSREQTARNHERVLEQAARLVRERGAAGVSIPEVMAAAGLTPGGFYKHFTSKDDLLAQAGAAAFTARLAALSDLAAAPDRAAAFERFLSDYLSVGHRDSPGRGCAGVSLAADAAHRDPDDPLRRAYVAGTRSMAAALQSLRPEGDGVDGVDGVDGAHGAEAPGPEALAELATMVGAVVLARATAGDDISERILAAAHGHLVERRRWPDSGPVG